MSEQASFGERKGYVVQGIVKRSNMKRGCQDEGESGTAEVDMCAVLCHAINAKRFRISLTFARQTCYHQAVLLAYAASSLPLFPSCLLAPNNTFCFSKDDNKKEASIGDVCWDPT